MSSKRKDSHPSKTTPTKASSSEEKSDGEEKVELKKEEDGNPEWTGYNALGLQKNPAQSPALSEQALDTTTGDDASSNGAKDDDDDDDEDDGSDDKLDGTSCGDPEKLKAFNMFVRLFVDENLDRHIPISKQPKEKIQAIIDSCTRQFPEFANRARKRIRTYLKSCRRTKRTREQAGLDGSNARPTPPHLTSVQAEQLLARACENEAENAKRMRMGMEPISQPMPTYTTNATPVDVLAAAAAANGAMQSGNFVAKTEYKPEQLATLLAASQASVEVTKTSAAAPIPTFASLNGAAMYRHTFQPTVASPAAVAFPGNPNLLQPQALQNATLQNGGPSDAFKKTPLLNHKLNATEIAAVRQLITGYRESAAFLLRSADELEHLLQIQPKL